MNSQPDPSSGIDSSSDVTAATPVDVIVPVYGGLEETRACLTSLLEAWQETPHEIIVIDDASPEPQISAYLEELRDAGAIM